MEHTEKKVTDHLESAKSELKDAASAVLAGAKEQLHDSMDSAKEKVNEAVGNAAAAVSLAADKVHDEVTKKAADLASDKPVS